MKCWRCREDSDYFVLIELYSRDDARPIQVVAEVVSCTDHRPDPERDFTEEVWESFEKIAMERRGTPIDRELTEVWSTPMTPRQMAEYIGPGWKH